MDIFQVAKSGDNDSMKTILADPSSDVNQANEDGRTSLFLASKNGHLEMVELLLSTQGVDVDKADNDGNTPLLVASLSGNVPIVKALLAAGVDTNKTDEDGHSALFFATLKQSRRGRGPSEKLVGSYINGGRLAGDAYGDYGLLDCYIQGDNYWNSFGKNGTRF